MGGALYPEWDVHNNRYRPEWCRVIDFPLTVAADVSAAGVPHDDVLRRRLSRVGLGPKVLRGRADGDDLDIEALIDLFVDLRSGYSPPEHIYLERRKLARNLGVLILLDASGSATDTDPDGLAVHDHQRRAAATLAVTLEELGDRVAVYAFRSHGRHAVHLPAIKTFGQRFGAVGRARLNQLQPSGYTRLGAGIRGAGEILKTEAGTPNRLLVVLSDGFPYDDGYEGRYAEADAHKALEELRTDGVACLCLSIGASTATDALERVFGSAGHASAATLADLSPRMDELFLSSLRELAAPKLHCEDETLKVLLTGAMGNIGFSTLEALLDEGHDVVAFDLESRRARKLASRFDGRVHVRMGRHHRSGIAPRRPRRRGRSDPSGGHHSAFHQNARPISPGRSTSTRRAA